MLSIFDDSRDVDCDCGIDLLDDLNEGLFDDDERPISDEQIRQQIDEDYELKLLVEEEQAQQLTEDYEDELEYNYFYENGDY